MLIENRNIICRYNNAKVGKEIHFIEHMKLKKKKEKSISEHAMLKFRSNWPNAYLVVIFPHFPYFLLAKLDGYSEERIEDTMFFVDQMKNGKFIFLTLS